MHLQMAERILADGRLGSQLQETIDDQLPAFYLGNVAPDYQTIAAIPREQTHFYNLPPGLMDDACRTMLAKYPELNRSEVLDPAQAVFVVAYCCHLLLDLRWYHKILIPVFLGPGEWDDHRHRFVVHNTLLTYLDKQAFDSLPDSAAVTLGASEPNGWLPFASNDDLSNWRNFLVSQLKPGASLHTVEIYASRLSMSPKQFSDNLSRPEWMEEHVFSRVDIDSVLSILTEAVSASVDLLADYLQVV